MRSIVPLTAAFLAATMLTVPAWSATQYIFRYKGQGPTSAVVTPPGGGEDTETPPPPPGPILTVAASGGWTLSCRHNGLTQDAANAVVGRSVSTAVYDPDTTWAWVVSVSGAFDVAVPSAPGNYQAQEAGGMASFCAEPFIVHGYGSLGNNGTITSATLNEGPLPAYGAWPPPPPPPVPPFVTIEASNGWRVSCEHNGLTSSSDGNLSGRTVTSADHDVAQDTWRVTMTAPGGATIPTLSFALPGAPGTYDVQNVSGVPSLCKGPMVVHGYGAKGANGTVTAVNLHDGPLPVGTAWPEPPTGVVLATYAFSNGHQVQCKVADTMPKEQFDTYNANLASLVGKRVNFSENIDFSFEIRGEAANGRSLTVTAAAGTGNRYVAASSANASKYPNCPSSASWEDGMRVLSNGPMPGFFDGTSSGTVTQALLIDRTRDGATPPAAPPATDIYWAVYDLRFSNGHHIQCRGGQNISQTQINQWDANLAPLVGKRAVFSENGDYVFDVRGEASNARSFTARAEPGTGNRLVTLSSSVPAKYPTCPSAASWSAGMQVVTAGPMPGFFDGTVNGTVTGADMLAVLPSY